MVAMVRYAYLRGTQCLGTMYDLTLHTDRYLVHSIVPYRNTLGDGIHDIYNEKVYKRLVSDALAQARMQVVNFGPANLTSEENLSGTATIPQPSADPTFLSDVPNSETAITDIVQEGPSSSVQDPNTDANPDQDRVVKPRASRGSTRRSDLLPPPSVRFGLGRNDSYESSAGSDRLSQNNQAGAATESPQPSTSQAAEVPPIPPVDEDLQISQGGRGSGSSTPMQQSSLRSQSSRQRLPKSPSASSSRRRQRTRSGGTVGSHGEPIREFGMGLGMDGIPVNSSTGLKLSSGRLGWPNQSHGRQQQDPA